ncbi:MAG: hypothetical protein JXK94_13950 [Deltaproteobacteria bacterium]|nr:hypothetical protein [Deltaproteobacteria bacterium]
MKRVSGFGNERGAVLITGLVLLLVLTLLGITSMQGITLQERMAGNLEQQDFAFQAAEAGLRAGEAYVQSNSPTSSDIADTSGLYSPASAGDTPVWKSVTWTDASNNCSANVRAYTSDTLKACYIIEFMLDEATNHFYMYRITSKGQTGNGQGEVVLQSTYKLPYTP